MVGELKGFLSGTQPTPLPASKLLTRVAYVHFRGLTYSDK
jgi:hypothetical protein